MPETTIDLLVYMIIGLVILGGIALIPLMVLNPIVKSDKETAKHHADFRHSKNVKAFKDAPNQTGVIKDVIILDMHHLSYILNSGESITVKNSPHIVKIDTDGQSKQITPPPNVGDTLTYRTFGGTSIYDKRQTWIIDIEYRPLFKSSK